MDHAEPMMLGSPVSNPGHISPPGLQTPHGSQFLPGYLMGDLSASTTPRSSRQKSVLGGGGASQYSTPIGSGMVPRTSPQKSKIRSPKHPSFAGTPAGTKEKVGAPPVQTLMDDFGHTEMTQVSGVTDLIARSSAFQESSAYAQHSPGTPRRPPAVLTPQRAKTPPSPGQTDPFYTQGELITPNVQLDDTWVTVFGFPMSSASFVLQRFSQYGNVLTHQIASDGGNWMHVHYESTLQARKALSRNGKILPGNVMIGVVPCIDVKVMADRNQTQNVTQALYQSPGHSMNRTCTPVRSMKAGSIRPLTAAYNAASSDNKVVSDVRTPQKTSGVITKAMDYLFG